MNNNVSKIAQVTGALVAFLALAAFALSYNALRLLAIDTGITGWLSFVWPLVLDAVVIAASLSVVRNGLLGERAWYAWGMVLLFSVVSIALNAYHAPNDLVSRFVYALPPFTLLLTFELFTAQVRSAVKRQGVTQSLESVTSLLGEKQQSVSQLSVQLEKLQEAVGILQKERDTLASDRDNLVSVVSELEDRGRSIADGQLLAIAEASPELNVTNTAKVLGVSRGTVVDRMAMLGYKYNGNGAWEVIE